MKNRTMRFSNQKSPISDQIGVGLMLGVPQIRSITPLAVDKAQVTWQTALRRHRATQCPTVARPGVREPLAAGADGTELQFTMENQ